MDIHERAIQLKTKIQLKPSVYLSQIPSFSPCLLPCHHAQVNEFDV